MSELPAKKIQINFNKSIKNSNKKEMLMLTVVQTVDYIVKIKHAVAKTKPTVNIKHTVAKTKPI